MSRIVSIQTKTPVHVSAADTLIWQLSCVHNCQNQGLVRDSMRVSCITVHMDTNQFTTTEKVEVRLKPRKDAYCLLYWDSCVSVPLVAAWKELNFKRFLHKLAQG